jgi:hypothetical protein
MATIVPISALPNGAVATNAALAAISVATLGENAVVRTLGTNTPNDGGANLYYFSASSTATVDNINVLSTPTTGRWIAALPSFSGVGPLTSNFTGIAENFVLLSGFAPVIYTLPPTANMQGKTVTIKTATTGTATIRCANAADLIVNAGATAASSVGVSVASTLTGGMTFNFLAYGARWYSTDHAFGAI